MEYLENHNRELLLLEVSDRAVERFEKITGIKLDERPKIEIFIPKENENILAYQFGDTIGLSAELLKDRKLLEYYYFHEFLHWALAYASIHLTKRNILDKLSNRQLVLVLTTCLEEKDDMGITNFIEEGTCHFFAAVLTSKSNAELLKNMFPNKNSIPIKTVIELVYEGFSRVHATPESEDNDKKVLTEMKEELLKKFQDSKATIELIGVVTVLFAYEMYKKEKKDPDKLLENLIFSPYTVMKELINEIKKDENKKLLQEAISDFSTLADFVGYLRNELLCQFSKKFFEISRLNFTINEKGGDNYEANFGEKRNAR
jgi:hypothetical protein